MFHEDQINICTSCNFKFDLVIFVASGGNFKWSCFLHRKNDCGHTHALHFENLDV